MEPQPPRNMVPMSEDAHLGGASHDALPANDGPAVVLFGILFGAIVAEKLTGPKGIEQYFLAVAGGAVLGSTLGYLASRNTGTVDDPQIEITLTTILAYGSYLLAFHLHLSGVIATASAGLMVGNFGAKKGMSARTR